jgi:hypothetical protein
MVAGARPNGTNAPNASLERRKVTSPSILKLLALVTPDSRPFHPYGHGQYMKRLEELRELVRRNRLAGEHVTPRALFDHR